MNTSRSASSSTKDTHSSTEQLLIRLVRWLIIAGVTIGSALAIVSLLGGEFGRTQGKIIATSFSTAGGGLLVLACLVAWEQGHLGPLPWFGSAVSTAGVGMLILGLWAELDSEEFVKAMATSLIVGGAIALLSLLTLAELAPRYRWVVGTAFGLLTIVAAYSIVLVWWEDPTDWAMRVFGVVAVLLASSIVTVPVLHLAAHEEVTRSTISGTPDRIRHCPMCGAQMEGLVGQSLSCPSCGRRFRVHAPPGTA